MSERAKPFVLNLENVPRAPARPSPEPEAATETSGQPGRVKIGEREFEARALTVTAKKLDIRVLRRHPAPPPRRVVAADVVRLSPIPITLPAPIRLSPPAPIPVTPRAFIRLTPPAPIPIRPRHRLVAAEPEAELGDGVAG